MPRQFQKLWLDKPERRFRLKCEFMKIIRAMIASAGLMFLCSCATQDSIRPALPAETFFNKEAGRDQRIYLTLHLEDGKELLFIADTGASDTVLDKSLEPVLGKCLGTRKIHWYGTATNANAYHAPKLYLGSTLLLTGNRIYTDDLSRFSFDRPFIMGILGMDCLRHYCIQLDLVANRIRFLDPDHPGNQNPDEKFPLALSFYDGTPRIHANFFGQSYAVFMVDTGCPVDAALKPKLFEQESQKLKEQTPGQVNFSKQLKPSTGEASADLLTHQVFFPGIIFGGEACTNFILGDCPNGNILGLRFLSRHLATLDFPKRTMRLQHSRVESFAAFTVEAEKFLPNFSSSAMEANKFVSNLKEQGQLPGWSKDEYGEVAFPWPFNETAPEIYPISRTFIATKKNNVSKYHYIVVRASKDGAWKLQRAWRTDAGGHILDEYPVP